VDFVDFALFAQHFGSKPDFECLWGIVEQRLDSTINVLETNPAYYDANYPRSTDDNGEWIPKAEGHWGSGFWPGAMWYLYKETGEKKWKDRAIDWTMPLERHRTRTNDHESGFIVFRSFGFDYLITGDANCTDVILDATESLLTRFDPDVECIESWNSYRHRDDTLYTYPVITDGMMMLEMVFWAAKNGGDAGWYDMAVSHANKVMQNNVRPNGSNWQIVAYDSDTGAVLNKMNKQGYDDDSTWSRGQAWGIAGFAIAYRETGDANYLDTSERMADWFIDNLPTDYVPYWDFNAPNIPNEYRDTSAAAIAASGMLELSELVSLQQDKEKYYNAACNILDSLSSPTYLAEDPNMGILLHGTANGTSPTGENDCSLIYGDHFFIEALLRKEGIKIK
jgi:unsaturated chondroitin disaccharide hydrolase